MRKRNCLIAIPGIQLTGGSEFGTLWIAEALKDMFDLTLVSTHAPPLERMNRSFGSSLKRADIKIISLPPAPRFLGRFDALRSYRVSRFCKKNAFQFDLLISGYGVMDFRRRGIQYIRDFSFSDRIRRSLVAYPKRSLAMFYAASPIRKIYIDFARHLHGFSEEGMRRNYTLANSVWTQRKLSDELGVDSEVIYPPVGGEFVHVPWELKEKGFVYLGRISPEKRIETLIEILRIARKKHPWINLQIVGSPSHEKYYDFIRRLCRANMDWIVMKNPLFGQDKFDFLSRIKFGISACRFEAFGIAIAEMIKAGQIVWAPKGGGQAEVIEHPMLLYDQVEDAVEKIDHILADEHLQRRLLSHLRVSSERFSTAKFIGRIREIVDRFMRTV